jgi:hypothetical protein
MFPRVYPAVPLAGIVPCVLFLLFGVFADLSPPPPAGALRPGTVMTVEQATGGRVGALVSVEVIDGPVICRIELPGDQAPAVGTRVTVDYSSEGCASAPVSEELPRWAFFAIGGAGLALMAFWLWAGRARK